jgi:hypothetical protein
LFEKIIIRQIENLQAENEKLKRLLLLTDDAVSDVFMNDLTMRQWAEFIKCFPEEIKETK